MKVHAKQGSGNGSIAVEIPLNDLSYNVLCSWATRAIESNSKLTKYNGKHKEQDKNYELHFGYGHTMWVMISILVCPSKRKHVYI